MELIRTLIKDKGQAPGPGPQNEIAQPDQRREDVVYPTGFTPLYAPNVHMTQASEIGMQSEKDRAPDKSFKKTFGEKGGNIQTRLEFLKKPKSQLS